MEEGTYGWCQGCGEAIATDRLEAVPHTRLCASCAREG
jgi:RNA polymerase-binding transcription factor DksA